MSVLDTASALLDASTAVSVADGHEQGGCECHLPPAPEPGQLLQVPPTIAAPVHAVGHLSATQHSTTFACFLGRLDNLQLRPLALFSKLTEGLTHNKNTVQLFDSMFQEMNTFVDPRLSGQTAKIMISFTVENKIKEQKYRQ